MKIHHIGYLIKNMDKGIESFTDMGYSVKEKVCYDSMRDIDLCFMENQGYVVELVCPKSENSIAWRLMKKYGNAPYHICYTVENMEAAIEELQGRGYVMTAKPAEAVGIQGKRVAFLTGRDMGMIELLESGS